eukprot:1996449-Heterocapsa_arctica.AAC.1
MREYLGLSRGMGSCCGCRMHLNSGFAVLYGSGRESSLATLLKLLAPVDQESGIAAVMHELAAAN